LRRVGCSEAQGWLFGRAVSADTVRTFLEMKQTDGAEVPQEPGSEDAAGIAPNLNRRTLRR